VILNLPSVFRHSAKSLPMSKKKVLGKEPFGDKMFVECNTRQRLYRVSKSLPNVQKSTR
jgi:hypothetical protein